MPLVNSEKLGRVDGVDIFKISRYPGELVYLSEREKGCGGQLNVNGGCYRWR
jgi:hypothetical protein